MEQVALPHQSMGKLLNEMTLKSAQDSLMEIVTSALSLSISIGTAHTMGNGMHLGMLIRFTWNGIQLRKRKQIESI